MRKLFRFKYEPCNGTCYVWCGFLPNELNKMDDKNRKDTIDIMVKAHSKLCDNPDFSFGVDLDEQLSFFVAHFRTPASTELFSSQSFSECVQLVCNKVLMTDIPQVNGFCNYGDNGAEDLGKEILRACIDIVYRNEHHESCPCKHVA